ncbi:MAG TPA: tyrosine-protein phosphatase [Pyrinomonadaceae bacterium]
MLRAGVAKASAALLALALLAGATMAQSEARYPELPEFHEVNRQLYRGAQPRDGGLRKLSELGIKTIISLRGENEITTDERKEAEGLGLRYFSVPLPGLSRPSNEQVERILALVNAPENQPVFVHCNHGKDRTGTIVAVYRITHDGWTSEQAKAEARRYGMSWVQRGMKDFISDYYRDWTKRKASVFAEDEGTKERLNGLSVRAFVPDSSGVPFALTSFS